MSDEVKGIWSPAPLGLAAFSFTLFIISVYNAGLLPAAGMMVAIGPCLFYGGLVQMLAGLANRHTDDLFGYTASTSYGAMLMSLGFILFGMATKLIEFGPATGSAMGIVFVSATIFTLYMWIASFKEITALAVLFTTLFIGLILLDLNFFGILPSSAPGGWVLIITSLVGWYTSAAIVLNTLYKKTVLPV